MIKGSKDCPYQWIINILTLLIIDHLVVHVSVSYDKKLTVQSWERKFETLSKLISYQSAIDYQVMIKLSHKMLIENKTETKQKKILRKIFF